MKLGKIFSKVRLLVHTDLTDEDLCDELNEILKELYRELPLPDKIYKFQTTEVPYYDLPADLAEDRIRVAIINGIEYEKLSPEIQAVDRPFCTVFMKKIFINPNPVGHTAYVYYRQRYKVMSATKLNEELDFPEDYQNILVFRLAKFAAIPQRDVDLINNFQNEADELLNKAKKAMKKMGLRRAKETTRW